MKGYKWITKDMKSKNGNEVWKLRQWKGFNGKLAICLSGFHASPTALDSLEYIYGDRWFIIETKGNILKDDDKFVASEMRLIKELPVKRILCWFAISCARRSLKYWNREYPNDRRPLEAIEQTEVYLKKPTQKNLLLLKDKISAVESVAWPAAESAWSAWSAAKSAWSALSAAESAAWSALSAAKSALSAAESAKSAERKWQKNMLEKMIREVVK